MLVWEESGRLRDWLLDGLLICISLVACVGFYSAGASRGRRVLSEGGLWGYLHGNCCIDATTKQGRRLHQILRTGAFTRMNIKALSTKTRCNWHRQIHPKSIHSQRITVDLLISLQRNGLCSL